VQGPAAPGGLRDPSSLSPGAESGARSRLRVFNSPVTRVVDAWDREHRLVMRAALRTSLSADAETAAGMDDLVYLAHKVRPGRRGS
jgi:hypothetical protein